MRLEDKYNLKKRDLYKHYKDDVLDFITLYIDYGNKLYEIHHKTPPKMINAFLAARAMDIASQKYKFKFPPLQELAADLENQLTNATLKVLD